MKTGWYNDGNDFFVVKPLHNGNRQSLIIGAQREISNKWNIFMGIFSSNATYNSIVHSSVWMAPTSTNKNQQRKIFFWLLKLSMKSNKKFITAIMAKWLLSMLMGWMNGVYVSILKSLLRNVVTKNLPEKAITFLICKNFLKRFKGDFSPFNYV